VGMPSDEQIVFLSTQISAALLENASMPEHTEGLRKAIRRWLPDAEAVDGHLLKTIEIVVRENLLIHRTLLLNRLDRLVEQGKAQAL
jgi:hypothetical protein